MTSLTLGLDAAFFAAIAVLFVYVGRIVHARATDAAAEDAGRMFAVWWYALAALASVHAVRSVLGAFEVRTAAPYILALHGANVAQVVALWALLFYILYVYTGRRGLLWPLAVFYAAVAVGVVYHFQAEIGAQDPSVVIGAWSANIELDLSRPDPVLQALLFALVVPQLGALGAYFSLVFKTKDRERRYRVLVVSSSLFVWLASSYAISATGTSVWFWPVAARVLALGTGLAVLAAFRPPARIRRWIGGQAQDPAARQSAFQERLAQLV